jgi:hypothetical protein
VRKQEAVLRLDFVEDSTVSWPRQDGEEVLRGEPSETRTHAQPGREASEEGLQILYMAFPFVYINSLRNTFRASPTTATAPRTNASRAFFDERSKSTRCG